MHPPFVEPPEATVQRALTMATIFVGLAPAFPARHGFGPRADSAHELGAAGAPFHADATPRLAEPHRTEPWQHYPAVRLLAQTPARQTP